MIPARLMPHTVTIRPLTGSGAYGPRYGPPVTVRARVATVRQLVRDGDGDEVVSETTVMLPAGTACAVESKIKLPGDTGERTVITSGVVHSARTAHHVAVTTN